MNKTLLKYSFILCLILVGFQPIISQDSLTVTGTIIGNNNQPLQDVSVSVEGENVPPALTDVEGKFILNAPSGEVWIIISPVRNYQSQRIFLNNRMELTIYLAEQEQQSGFDDISLVNTTKYRRDIITSFTSVDLKRINENNFITVDQSFQGKIPGVLTMNQSGMPGTGTINFIRGVNSLHTTNAPLYILNGMLVERPGLFETELEGNLYNPLTTIDPSDISSIVFLKDPVATSIYGSKGSNGVVLIETLEAKATETTIKVSTKAGYIQPSLKYKPLLNPSQYKLLANEILMSSPQRLEEFEDNYPGLYVHEGDDDYYRYMHNTNWQSLIFADAFFTSNYLSFKGGSEIATYGLSVGYHDQGGTIKNTSYNRFNVAFVSDLNVYSWLKVNVNASLANSNAYLRESALSLQTSPIFTALSKPPMMDPYQYDDEGNPLSQLDEVDELGTSNPLAVVDNFIGENKNYRFISSLRGQASITETLSFTTLLGLNFNTMKEFVFKPNIGMEKYYFGEAHNVAQITNNYLLSVYNDNYFNYQTNLNKFNIFSSSLGVRVFTNSLQVDFGEGLNLPDNDQYTSLQSGQNELKNIAGHNSNWNWLSVYHQLSYKYKDKYILNTGLSADFSSRIGKEANTAFMIRQQPFGLFYSVGGGWRISEESFMKRIDLIDYLLLRTSYGITGNDDIGNNRALDFYTPVFYRETSGLIPGQLPNQSLKYEQVNQFTAGVDLSLKGARTYLTANYFVKKTNDLFIFQNQSSYTGFERRPTNAGSLKNRGWEISFFQRLVEGQNFSWDISIDLTLIANEVIDLQDQELITSFQGGEFLTKEGGPVNSFYGYNFEGVFATQEEAEQAGLINELGIPFGAGDAIYEDISGPEDEPDGVIDGYDKIILGSPIPDFFGGFSNNFRYKRWSLNLMIQFVSGNEIYNYTRYLNERMVDLSNQSTHVLNRWKFDGDETDVPRALYKDPVGNSNFSSRWIEDGAYLRLKTLSIRYSIPQEFLVFKSADFYITAQNLITFSKYLGYDPEFSYSFRSMQQGIDYALMPQPRQFMIGVKIGI